MLFEFGENFLLGPVQQVRHAPQLQRAAALHLALVRYAHQRPRVVRVPLEVHNLPTRPGHSRHSAHQQRDSSATAAFEALFATCSQHAGQPLSGRALLQERIWSPLGRSAFDSKKGMAEILLRQCQ